MPNRFPPSVALSRSLALAIRSLRRRGINPAVFRVSLCLRLLCSKGERRFVHGHSPHRGGPLLEYFEIRDEGIERMDVLFAVSSVVPPLVFKIRSLLRGASSGGCGFRTCFPSGSRSSIKETHIIPVRFGRLRGCPFFAFVFETLD